MKKGMDYGGDSNKPGGRYEENAVRGQKLRTECAPDRSSFMGKSHDQIAGRKMGGGPRDVSHSLGGAGETMDYNNKPAGRGSSKGKDGRDYR